MSKLYDMKQWVTVKDAARHLSIVLDEEVTEADVLRLVLDGHLTLSVNLVNHATAKRGKVVSLSEAKTITIPALSGEVGKTRDVVLALRLNEKDYLELDEDVVTLAGIWDLPMIGTERLDVEHKYQILTGGPAVTLEGLDGTFLEGDDGVMFQLQESFDENEYQAGSRARLKSLKQHIADNNVGEGEAKELLSRYTENRKKFLKASALQSDAHNYYPAGCLPQDSVLVVRTQALRQLQEAIASPLGNVDKPLKTTERNTLLTIIAALCNYGGIKYEARGAAGTIAAMTDTIGASVTDDTIRNVLSQIPSALETRMK
ncbi:MAG: hypothetical protein ACYCXX_13680 [Acidiferrobacter thiooxydans]